MKSTATYGELSDIHEGIRNALNEAGESSAQAPVENRGAGKLVGSDAGVRTAVSSAEALCARWEKDAKDFREYGARRKTASVRVKREAEAKIFEACASQLRRQVAAWTEQQPPSNNFDQPTPVENQKPQ